MESWIFEWVALPLLIFVSRVIDVSIGSVRIIFLYRGLKLLTPILAFFEVLIWLFAIRVIFLNLANPVCFIAFAAGFATGNYVGILLEERLALGYRMIQVITRKDASELIAALKQRNFGVTRVNAEGTTGAVHVIFMVLKREHITEALTLVRTFNPKAFYSVGEVREVREGIFPQPHFLR